MLAATEALVARGPEMVAPLAGSISACLVPALAVRLPSFCCAMLLASLWTAMQHPEQWHKAVLQLHAVVTLHGMQRAQQLPAYIETASRAFMLDVGIWQPSA